MLKNKLYCNKGNDYLVRTMSMNEIGFTYTINNYNELFNLINKMTVTIDNEAMSSLIDLGFKKDFNEIKNFLFEGDSYYLAGQNILFSDLKDNNNLVSDLNVINSCLFVVSDLNIFIKNLKVKGYEINEGPQK
jgi:hypothetical protein